MDVSINYLRRVLIGIPLVLGIVAATNVVIDPYRIYRPDARHSRPAIPSHARLHKAYAVEAATPKTIFLGSSRTEQGLSPAGEGVPQPCYNLALNGANVYEMLRYLEHAIEVTPVENVVVGMELLQFHARSTPRPDFFVGRLAIGWPKNYRAVAWSRDFGPAIMSVDALRDSVRTVVVRQQQPILYDDGMQDSFIHEGATHGSYHRMLDGYRGYLLRPNMYRDFELRVDGGSYDPLGCYAQLVELCRAHDIKLYVFISPGHAYLYGAMERLGLWPVYEEWKRNLVRISRELGGKKESDIELWDFSGYNSITTENVPGPEDVDTPMRWFRDGSHYRPAVGELVLARLFDTAIEGQPFPEDFGRRIDSTNIEQHLAQLRREGETYRKTHPEVVNLLDSVASEVGATAPSRAKTR